MKFVSCQLLLLPLLLGCQALASTVTGIVKSRAVDLTLQPGASGEDVVDACILKINNLQVFLNDFGITKRIALVETNFGLNIADPTGGIWQISPDIQALLQQYQFPSLLLLAIDVAFGADMVNFASSDFSVPLRSAVAARLYIYIQTFGNNQDVPGSISNQAIWWSTSYNTNGDANVFETRVTEFESSSGCTIDKMDIWFLLDGSGSVSQSDYTTSLQFVDEISRHFNIAPNGVRAGFSTYSSSHTFISKLNDHTTNVEFSNVVTNTTKPNGSTETGAAIEDVVDNGLSITAGARPLSSGVARVLIVMTDGQSGDDVLTPADYARNNMITVFGVGIGSGVDEDEIKEIANDPDSAFAFSLNDFTQLRDVLMQSVEEQTCQISVEIQDNTTVSTTVVPGDTHYSTAQFPINGSIELTFEVTSFSAVGVVYFSADFVNPSPALHHISIEITFGITVIVINDDDLLGVSLVQSSNIRNKRSISDEPKPLFFGVKSTGSAPLDINYKSVGSNMKRNGVAPKMKICVSLWIISVLASYISF